MPAEPLLFQFAARSWSRLQQGPEYGSLWMSEVRAIDGCYTIALGNGQTGRFHAFQFAMRGGEAYLARARECADAPAGPVGPKSA
jgi:hypothetical protein